MKCPYCNNDMVLGVIRGGRDSKVEGHYCKECNKITIDLPTR